MSISDDRNLPFYWGMIRKYIICFSSIFSELAIQKFNQVGEVVKTVSIPYSVAMKEKVYYKEAKKDVSVNLVLPRIEYRFTSMTPDQTRANSKNQMITATLDDIEEEYIYAGKPWNFDVEVKILSKSLTDMFQIIENIMVKFDPDYILTIKEIPGIISRNVQVISTAISLPDEFDFDETSDRRLESVLNFTLKGYLYPPIKNSYIIKQITINYASQAGDNITEAESSIITSLES
jgi:hypothetical protein